MPIISRVIFFSVLFLGWGIPFSLSSFQAKENPIQVSISIPSLAVDLSDLDVRDAQNKHVHAAAAKQQLEALFINGLNTMLMLNLTPVTQFVRDLMTQVWKLFSTSLGRAARRAFEIFTAWFQSKKYFSNIFAIAVGVGLSPRLNTITGLGAWRPHFPSQVSSILSSTQILR